jgi:choline-glycine betaine transporter
MVMFERTGQVAFAALAWALLTLVTVVVVYLLYRTLRAAAVRGICVPAH